MNSVTRQSSHAESDQELYEAFTELYNKGYRFIDDVTKQAELIQSVGGSTLHTPLVHSPLAVDGIKLSYEEKERSINFIMFLRSIKNRVHKQ